MKPTEKDPEPTVNLDERLPEDLSLELEKGLLERTKFPEEEYELPDQTPEDLGKKKEATA